MSREKPPGHSPQRKPREPAERMSFKDLFRGLGLGFRVGGLASRGLGFLGFGVLGFWGFGFSQAFQGLGVSGAV